MALAQLHLNENYWTSLEINPADIEFLYAFLLEVETPLPSTQLAEALIKHRIAVEKKELEAKQKANGRLYLPQKTYAVGEKVQFPASNWINGEVIDVRKGNNPELPELKVMTVKLESGHSRKFAINLEDHKLNDIPEKAADQNKDNSEGIIETFGDIVTNKLEEKLEENQDLVRIGAEWFPRSLLIEFNVGHLNLAEAVLDMHDGGPLPVETLIDEIDFKSDDIPELVRFSMSYALQEDPRFDEVGPKGIVLWFLNRLEPDNVREKPIQLIEPSIEYDRSLLTEDMLLAEQRVDDELVKPNQDYLNFKKSKEILITLNYPHWRVGSLPLTVNTRRFFPTALETQRVKFTLIDSDGKKISAWVVRPYHYVYGLREWYEEQELMPGNIIRIKQSNKLGEVLIQPEKQRTNREWVRTMLIGADDGVVFAMLKQVLTADFNERMTIAVPSTDVLDDLWRKRFNNPRPLEQDMTIIMKELAKLNPQGHVHAIELYAAINCIRRCSPGLIFSRLASSPDFISVGDLYFRLAESS
jgi:hypothetical protein